MFVLGTLEIPSLYVSILGPSTGQRDLCVCVCVCVYKTDPHFCTL